MKYIKKYEELYETDSFSGGGAYPGPPINSSGGNLSHTLAAGGSDGQFGNSSAMGGEYPKKYAPPSPEKTPYKQNIKSLKTKETKKRRNAIQKIKRLDMLSFNDFKNKKEEK